MDNTNQNMNDNYNFINNPFIKSEFLLLPKFPNESK